MAIITIVTRKFVAQIWEEGWKVTHNFEVGCFRTLHIFLHLHKFPFLLIRSTLLFREILKIALSLFSPEPFSGSHKANFDKCVQVF